MATSRSDSPPNSDAEQLSADPVRAVAEELSFAPGESPSNQQLSPLFDIDLHEFFQPQQEQIQPPPQQEQIQPPQQQQPTYAGYAGQPYQMLQQPNYTVYAGQPYQPTYFPYYQPPDLTSHALELIQCVRGLEKSVEHLTEEVAKWRKTRQPKKRKISNDNIERSTTKLPKIEQAFENLGTSSQTTDIVVKTETNSPSSMQASSSAIKSQPLSNASPQLQLQMLQQSQEQPQAQSHRSHSQQQMELPQVPQLPPPAPQAPQPPQQLPQQTPQAPQPPQQLLQQPPQVPQPPQPAPQAPQPPQAALQAPQPLPHASHPLPQAPHPLFAQPQVRAPQPPQPLPHAPQPPQLLLALQPQVAQPQVQTPQPPSDCVFCGARHWANACTVYTTLTARSERLKEKGRCERCLGPANHLVTSCQPKHGCFFCKMANRIGEQKTHHSCFCTHEFRM